MYSRGSVIPLFVRQIKSGKPITLTDPDMTRFLLPLRQAVDLVLFALKNGDTGDIFVRKAPASTVFDLAKACLNVFDANNEIITIGVREGEKMHETLATQEELARAQDFGDYYRVISDRSVDYDKYLLVGNKGDFPAASYTSENTTRLSIWQVEKLLLSLPEIQHELGIAVTQIYQGLQPSSFS
jgi:UDP-glucose 4-epimerase